MIKTPFTYFIVLLIVIFAISCTEIKTSDVKESYKYWTGTKPPANLELMNGQYWESAHWSKEYIIFLKFKPTEKWWIEFVKQNQISVDKNEWTMPSNAPAWFKLNDNLIRYSSDNNFDQGSRYFRDSITGICYIYEIQL